jgi:hypothetical protein
MAGQSVGLVDQVLPLKQALGELIHEAEEALEKIKGKCEAL